jgi:hypothetical protein
MKSRLLFLSTIVFVLSCVTRGDTRRTSSQIGNTYTWVTNANGRMGVLDYSVVNNRISGHYYDSGLSTAVEGYQVGRHVVMFIQHDLCRQIWNGWISKGGVDDRALSSVAGTFSSQGEHVHPWYGYPGIVKRSERMRGGKTAPDRRTRDSIPLKGQHESNVDYQVRMQAQAKSIHVILPRSENETSVDFQVRAQTQTKSQHVILPRSELETSVDFQVRAQAQARSEHVILPRGEYETSIDFQVRAQAQAKTRHVIRPRSEHESGVDFQMRVRAMTNSKGSGFGFRGP